MDNEKVQIFVNVDEDGNIITAYSGEKIVATEDFDSYFYFFKSQEVVDNIDDYQVKMVGMKPDLVLKSTSERDFG